MTKYFLYILLLTTIISCKKKTCEQEILPDTILTPKFYGELNSWLVYNIKNGNIDTLLQFYGSITKELNGKFNNENYTSVRYNSSSVDFDNLPNFMSYANNSNWQVTSNFVGNFNYTDNRLSPNCLSCGSMTPSLSVSTGLSLDLNGITNCDEISIEIRDSNGSNGLATYNMTGASTFSITLTDVNSSVGYLISSHPVNTPFILTITFSSVKNEIINGVLTAFRKSTIYRYITKSVN
jgi:hypothetical protein